jgi:predicted RNase H-like HicB family nuclease
LTTIVDYLMLVEGDGATDYSAWSPDLPGCVAAGPTLDETVKLMLGAIDLHLSGLKEDGQQAPAPSGPGVYVDAHLSAA